MQDCHSEMEKTLRQKCAPEWKSELNMYTSLQKMCNHQVWHQLSRYRTGSRLLLTANFKVTWQKTRTKI